MNKLAKITAASSCQLPITDHAGLRTALAEANLPSLLMVCATLVRSMGARSITWVMGMSSPLG